MIGYLLGWVDKILHSLADPTDRMPIEPEGGVQSFVPGIEVQVPSVGGRLPRSRPVVAAQVYVGHGRIVAEPGGGEEHRVSVKL